MTWHVEDNVTGARASKDFQTREAASQICRALNIDAGPGGRFGVYDQDGIRDYGEA